jgi:hypothetical protein
MMVNVKNVGHVVRNPPARKASLADAPGRRAWRVRPVCVCTLGKTDGVAKAIARHRGVKAAHAYWDRAGRDRLIAFAETAS